MNSTTCNLNLIEEIEVKMEEVAKHQINVSLPLYIVANKVSKVKKERS